MKSDRLIAAVCLAIVALLVAGGLAHAANKDTLGTFSVSPTTLHYGDTVTLSWDLPRRTQAATVGILCRHDFNGGVADYVYISEWPIGKGSLSGSVGWALINETSSALPGRLDYTRIAYCVAGMWEERPSTGKGPYGITNFVSFDVEP